MNRHLGNPSGPDGGWRSWLGANDMRFCGTHPFHFRLFAVDFALRWPVACAGARNVDLCLWGSRRILRALRRQAESASHLNLIRNFGSKGSFTPKKICSLQVTILVSTGYIPSVCSKAQVSRGARDLENSVPALL